MLGNLLLIDIHTAFPEIYLALASMALLLYGVFRGDGKAEEVCRLAVILLLGGIYFVYQNQTQNALAFNGLFKLDGFSSYLKILCLSASILTLMISVNYLKLQNSLRFEFPVLVMLATLGMMMMVSANDLISVYIAVELQSLSLYVLAAIRRDTYKSTEAGLKYFILGALSSGMLLYGMSLVYGFSGTTNFDSLAVVFESGTLHIGIVVGLVFMIAALAFKISGAPFHMWTPDVYEGAPTPITAFFAVGPKVAAIGLFIRVMMDPFADLIGQWQQVIILISIASMVVGAFGAIAQTNIKRLLAYSSIGHMGYALIGLATGTEEGIRGIIIYMTLYLAMSIGAFAIIIAMRKSDRVVENISDLAGLSKSHPMMAMAMAIFMFSMAGIPPLAGFLGKLYVFLSAVEAGLYGLAVIGVLSSVVAAYYYIRIIKVMYFDESSEMIDRNRPGVLNTVIAGSSLFTVGFFLYPSPIIAAAGVAANSFFDIL